MTQIYNYSCQGESHKNGDNKPGQDYSISYRDNDVAIAIVSDGHGGDRYFRSHFGSQFIAEITKACVIEKILPIGEDLFEGKSFTQVGVSKERKDKPIEKDIERVMQNLFSSIITLWYDEIMNHAKNNPLTAWEESHVPEKYKQEFNEQNKLEKNYGCTLMVYVQTANYWLAFHIGDGKCVSFQFEDGRVTCKEPILWDEQCFLNTTTSICDSNAIEEFRYSYCGDGTFPFAVFLGSDGIDDSYGTPENLSLFYVELLQEMMNKTPQEMNLILEESLPEISRIGSQDDMSVACVFDDMLVKEAQTGIFDYLKRIKKQHVEELKERKKAVIEKIKEIEYRSDDKSKEVNLKYARKDLAKIDEEINGIEKFLEEIDVKEKMHEQQQALETTKKQNEALSQKLDIALQKEEQLLKEIKEKIAESEELAKDVEYRQNMIDSLQNEIDKLQKDKERLLKHNESLNTGITDLEEANCELSRENGKLKKIKKGLMLISIILTLVVGVLSFLCIANCETNEVPNELLPENVAETT